MIEMRKIEDCSLDGNGGACCAVYHVGPLPHPEIGGRLTEGCCAHCQTLITAVQALDALDSISSFAYETGFHELGYDPVDALRLALGLPKGSRLGKDHHKLTIAVLP